MIVGIRAWLRSVGVTWRIRWRDLMWRKVASKSRVRTLVLLHEVGKTSLVMPLLALRDDSSG